MTQPFLTGMEGEERRRDLSQFFTEPALAQRVWDWCPLKRHGDPIRICEPAAGKGALIRPMLTGDHRPDEIVAYEVDPWHQEHLISMAVETHGVMNVRRRSFTADPDPGRFDLFVQNPPYEDGQEDDFIEHALDNAPATIGIFRAAIVFGEDGESKGRWNTIWRWTDIKRLVWLSKRPDFGGDFGAKTDFLVLHLTRRAKAREKQEPHTCTVEWW